ncbi:hypothetical protein E4Z66_11240 [Aliishimia ponticola]|uniref:Uncharacterized protein n=1 Tax=Aliishimia ponticola TaxID=2499833 RepID=A0A4V3XK59_9RHOB|nr:hypothetical protein [Aliishimia ponticola]THH35663.1 hypothetical protein E4Z66_11240 [Aliishimia ponticola]
MKPLRIAIWLAVAIATAAILWVLAHGGVRVSAEPVPCGMPPAKETSADYLLRSAHCLYDSSEAPQDQLRLALIDDLYIKGWSYSVLNKICFWASILLGVTVLIYPALGPVFTIPTPKGEDPQPKTWLQRALGAASVQTAVTALAAATFAFYAHYKERQSGVETMMRELMVRETVDAPYLEDLVGRIGRMDAGFGFAALTGSER